MKKYLIILLIIVSAAVFFGCATPNNNNQTNTTNRTNTTINLTNTTTNQTNYSQTNTTCNTNQIMVNGVCAPRQNTTNVQLFNQDLEPYVETMMVDTNNVQGFLAKPKAEGNYPGIIMIHEWWGLNDNIKEMATILANEGYVVFAVDLYDGEIATNTTRAADLTNEVRSNPNDALEKMQSAVEYLRNEENVEKIGSLGWCFGGGQSLELAMNEPLDATVIYYGTLTNDTTDLENINSPVLGIFGSNDTSIPVSDVNNFEDNLNELDIENNIYIYPNVGHAFANPSGNNYAAKETIDAWNKTVKFLNDNLKKDMKVFNFTGENFEFSMNNETVPTLEVEMGDRVRINFRSEQGFHDWVLDEFNSATMQVWAPNATYTEFIANKRGTFEYYCSVGTHRQMGMVGDLIVK